MKKTFIAEYNYGMGSLWFLLEARSAAEIEEKFPNLEVRTKFPANFTEIDMRQISNKFSYDVEFLPSDLYPEVFSPTKVNQFTVGSRP